MVYSATPVSTGMRPAGGLLQFADDFKFFAIIEGGVFTDGAERNHAVNAGFDHGIQVFGGGGEIERLIMPELGGDGGEDAVPSDFHMIYNL